MKLAKLTIENYRGITGNPLSVFIDDIVVLIGPNNVGKSSVLDAYEAFASTGAARDITEFPHENTNLPIQITGTFTELSGDDIKTIGKEWKHYDDQVGECVKVRWQWASPSDKGQKYSWNPTEEDWKKRWSRWLGHKIHKHNPFPATNTSHGQPR